MSAAGEGESRYRWVDESLRTYIEMHLDRMEERIAVQTADASADMRALIRRLPELLGEQLLAQGQRSVPIRAAMPTREPAEAWHASVADTDAFSPDSSVTSSGVAGAHEVASVFLWWCQNAGGNVARVRDFTETIKSRLTGIEVQVVSRDRDSNSISFVAEGAVDPIEYWMVTLNRGCMLFPRPLNALRFKELYPVYEGESSPQALRSIEPAVVRQDGNRWLLETLGRVNSLDGTGTRTTPAPQPGPGTASRRHGDPEEIDDHGHRSDSVALSASTPPAAVPTPPGDLGVSSQVATVFLWWCQNAGEKINRVRDFAEAIRIRVTGSEVQVLTRDRDSNAVTFVSEGAGDPIEYWMVAVNRACLLFPRPLNYQRFKELAPAFEGEASPQTLHTIEPAVVRQEGNRWVLEKVGRVS